MCGIAGAYLLNGSAVPVDQGLADAVACIAHRGPDDHGIHVKGKAALGHRRLSILDTSSAGHQPFTDNNGRHTIIFNGEVFNFPVLRRQLEEQGHQFRSQTDTEVVLRLFILKGPAFLHDLNGFFALAIHDAETDELFIARDRFGVKPLLWCEHEGRLLFASEIRALQRMGAQISIDRTSLRTYFTHHYIPAPHSIAQAIHKLRPGHSIHVKNGSVDIARWYNAEEAAAKARNLGDPVKQVQELLEDAVRIRLLSDVPVGTFLSGGLDSSIVSALAKKHHPNLHTFSIGFTDRYFDETPYAEAVARHIGSDHHTFTLGFEELAGAYEGFLSIIDEPFADSSALPSYLLNKYTRRHVVVALSGDGADEVFGGYRKHQAELRAMAPGLREKLALLSAPLLSLLPRSRNNAFADKVRQLDKFVRVARMTPGERYLELASFEDQKVVNELLRGGLDEQEWDRRREEMIRPLSEHPDLNGLLWADVLTVLPNDMLYKVDLTSMAHALEVRTPFLDHRLVSYAFSLPPAVKFQPGSGKQLLRKAFGHMLPPVVLERRKQGFEIPLRKLFLGPLKEVLRYRLQPDLLQEAGISPTAVDDVIQRLKSASPGNAQATVHALLVYMSWWQRQFR